MTTLTLTPTPSQPMRADLVDEAIETLSLAAAGQVPLEYLERMSRIAAEVMPSAPPELVHQLALHGYRSECTTSALASLRLAREVVR